MKIEKIYCDICKSPPPVKANWSYAMSEECSLDLKSSPGTQTKVVWHNLCHKCARGILDSVQEFIKNNYKDSHETP